MANTISFKKWNNEPYSIVGQKMFETKYFNLGSSSNKVVVLKFILNLIADAGTTNIVYIYYRTNVSDAWQLFGFDSITYSASAQGGELTIEPLEKTLVSNASGVQFKVVLNTANGDVSINDYHFIYRKKRNYSVSEVE